MRAGLFYLFVISVLLVACNRRPDYVIDEETMTDLLFDVPISEGLLDVQGQQMSDHTNYGQEVMAAVLLKHGVTRAQYDTSLVWYSQNLKKLIRIYDDVNKKLESQSEKWSILADERKSNTISISGDNVDIWALNRSLLLDESRLSQALFLSIPTDSCFYAGDTIRWKLHVCSMPAGQGVVASMALLTGNETFNTDDYLVGESTEPIGNDSTICITLAPDKDVKLSKISLCISAIRTSGHNSHGLYPAMVDSLELVRVHRK